MKIIANAVVINATGVGAVGEYGPINYLRFAY